MPTTQFFGVVQSADQQGNLITDLYIPRDRAVGNGNNVCVGLVYSTTTETISVTDDQSNTYTKRSDVTGGARHQMWTCENITNGPRIIHIHVTGSGSSYLSGWWGEGCGVGAFDKQTSNSGSSTTPNAGAFTPVNGALIVMDANQDQLATPFLDSWTPDSGYTSMSADLNCVFLYSQWRLHTSGATTPGCTLSPSRTWTSTAISWVPDTSKGTDPPSTIRIDRMSHHSFQLFTGSPWKVQCPSANADTIALWFENSPAAGDVVSITDTNGNTWKKAGSAPNGAGGTNECWYCDRPSGSSALIASIFFNGSDHLPTSGQPVYGPPQTGGATGDEQTGDCLTTFLALRNTVTNAVQDSATSTTGLDSSNTSIVGANTEPSQLHCMILSMLGVESNTVLSVDSGNFVSCTSTPTIGSPAPLMQNNGYCVDYPTNTTIIQRTWTLDAAPGYYQELNVVFLGVPPPASRDAEGYRWRADDGSESAATWLASQDTDISRAVTTNTRLRSLTNLINDAPNEGFKLQYRQVGDTQWKDIN